MIIKTISTFSTVFIVFVLSVTIPFIVISTELYVTGIFVDDVHVGGFTSTVTFIG